MKVRLYEMHFSKVEMILLFLNWIPMMMDLRVVEPNRSCNLVTLIIVVIIHYLDVPFALACKLMC